MSDEPLGDDTKPRSFDVTFSNPLFDFNDDFTLCKDNPLFDEEIKDISSLDPPKLTSVIDEPTLLVTLPLPCTDVLGDTTVDIDLLLGEQLDTLSTGDREINFNPSRDIEELEHLLADDPVPVPRVFDEPLGNTDSMSRSSETSDLFEELIAEFGQDDSIPTEIDDRIPYDLEDLRATYTLLSHFNESSPDYETFCFDIGEKSSDSTTSHSDHSLSEYESFCFDVDHIEKKSSGSTTSHCDLSLLEYESFHFDLSIDPLPPADRSDSHLEEFADELAHIISPPEYDRFYFDLEDISEKTRVMETSSFGFHHMPLPHPAAYSPKEVMYCYYHPHLTSGDGFDPKSKNPFVEIPSDESKIHIEVLSVLWGNRLPGLVS
ncbi:hypothetical protein Tco_0241332 [Tanacetum coccineum]